MLDLVNWFYSILHGTLISYGSPYIKTIRYVFQDAVAIVQHITEAEEASRKLIKEAYARGSSDNITCVVVRFDVS